MQVVSGGLKLIDAKCPEKEARGISRDYFHMTDTLNNM